MAGTAGVAAPPKPVRVFLLEQYFLKNGSQPGRLQDYLREGLLPAWKKTSGGAAIFLDAAIAPHRPQMAVITEYPSFESLREIRERLVSDKGHQKVFEAWESHAEQPYERMTATLLQATDYCPLLAAPKDPPKKPRVYELRVYHSPTWRQLAALHERFAGPEIKIFHRVGVHPILYSSTMVGPDMPNLTYLTPFDDLASREKAWDAFGADPEWVKVRKESIDRSGQISIEIQISLYNALPFSPIR